MPANRKTIKSTCYLDGLIVRWWNKRLQIKPTAIGHIIHLWAYIPNEGSWGGKISVSTNVDVVSMHLTDESFDILAMAIIEYSNLLKDGQLKFIPKSTTDETI